MLLFEYQEAGHNSDEQRFGKPQGYKGKGKKSKGQGTDLMILNKLLTLLKGQGFSEGSEVLF